MVIRSRQVNVMNHQTSLARCRLAAVLAGVVVPFADSSTDAQPECRAVRADTALPIPMIGSGDPWCRVVRSRLPSATSALATTEHMATQSRRRPPCWSAARFTREPSAGSRSGAGDRLCRQLAGARAVRLCRLGNLRRLASELLAAIPADSDTPGGAVMVLNDVPASECCKAFRTTGDRVVLRGPAGLHCEGLPANLAGDIDLTFPERSHARHVAELKRVRRYATRKAIEFFSAMAAINLHSEKYTTDHVTLLAVYGGA